MGIKRITAGAALLALGTTLLVTPMAGATAPPPDLRGVPVTVQAGGSLGMAKAESGVGCDQVSLRPAPPKPTGTEPTTAPSSLTTAPSEQSHNPVPPTATPSELGDAAASCAPAESTGPQVRIRPKGAPQTGDGSTAAG